MEEKVKFNMYNHVNDLKSFYSDCNDRYIVGEIIDEIYNVRTGKTIIIEDRNRIVLDFGKLVACLLKAHPGYDNGILYWANGQGEWVGTPQTSSWDSLTPTQRAQKSLDENLPIRGNPEIMEITCQGDVAGSLNNKYWLIDSPTNAYYVWYNVSGGGTGPSPAPSGRSGIPVNISTGASASDVALATASALDLTSDFIATFLVDVVTVTCEVSGFVTNPADGNTGWGAAFIVTQEGWAFQQLYSETSVLGDTRKTVTIDFIDGNNNIVPHITSRLQIEAVFGTDVSAYLREFTLVGSNATSSPDTGIMVNHKAHAVIGLNVVPPADMILTRKLRLTL